MGSYEKNGPRLLKFYRLLTPENQELLSSLVCLACFSENSARKDLGFGDAEGGACLKKLREYSRKDA